MNKLRESLNKLICEGTLTSSQIINDFRVRYIHFFCKMSFVFQAPNLLRCYAQPRNRLDTG